MPLDMRKLSAQGRGYLPEAQQTSCDVCTMEEVD